VQTFDFTEGHNFGEAHTDRQSEIAHRQSEGQAADSPEESEEEGPEESLCRCFGQNGQQVSCEKAAENPWGDDPAEEAAHEPVRFPGPALHTAIRHVEAAEAKPPNQ